MVLSIGQVAEDAAVSIQTVRYYERLGLIAPPPRAKNRYRQYDLATVRRLRSGSRCTAAAESGVSTVRSVQDTATVRLHISGMIAIATELTRRTGYAARIIPDSIKSQLP